jgi:hypothetical protein
MQENMLKPAKSERRKTSRKSPPSLVYVELGGGNGGMLRDLSAEGFAIRAMMPLRPGDKTPFCIVLNAAVRIEGQGEVLWSEENGRVAGLRFLEVSPKSVSQMQGWLTGTLETPEVNGDLEKAVAQEAQSFDQLRHELRFLSPVTGPVEPEPEAQAEATIEEAKMEETVTDSQEAAEPEFSGQVLEQEHPPTPAKPPVAPVHASVPEEIANGPEPVFVSATAPPPGLPDFTSTQQAIEISFESVPPAPAPAPRVPERFPRLKSDSPNVQSLFAEEDEPPQALAGMPDISQILMQPGARDFGARRPALEPLDAPGNARARAAGMMESFTLPKAILTMVALVLLAAIFTFRHAAGEALIWLGESMGGAQTSQIPETAPAPPETSTPGSSPTTNDTPGSTNSDTSTNPASSTSSAETPASGGTSSVPAQTTQQSSDSTQHPPAQNPRAQNPVPTMTRTTQPPVTPLAGLPEPAGANAASESGSAEYSKAMQLLHGKGPNSDPSEAVRLLWISVEKGNASAELTLAELYWHGEGVTHNCDQTRILLSAAARKGNVDALRRLQQFQQQGCE